MIQIELYLKEISNFLRTLTIKNTYFADHMFDTWVQDKYKDKIDYTLHPYYRNITGDYILFNFTTLERAYGIFKERLTAAEYNYKYKTIIAPLVEEYGLKITSNVNGNEVPNSHIYTKCNTLPIVSSYDTKEKIPFTKSLLTSKHTNTAEIYKIPNERYFRLLEKYPESSDIIKSIVYPIKSGKDKNGNPISPLEVAYRADNLSLLAYNTDMLETQEVQSMYDCILSTLDMVRRRYAIDGFCFENMYPQALQYMLWQILWLALSVQRIVNIKSGNVHTYHIWSYLKSHGLDDYRDVLTIRQQLFLYRNLMYLIEHKGTQHALEILIYVLLTTQNISLQGKDTIQMITNENGYNTVINEARKHPSIQSVNVAKPLLDGIADMYKKDPNTRFQSVIDYMGKHAGENSLNDQQEYEAGYSERTETIYNKERQAGLEYQEDYLFKRSTENCNHLISTSPISHRNTKLLELTNGTSSDLYAQLYTKFVAESMIYRAALGDMNFSIAFTVPGNPMQVVLTAKEALGVVFYTLSKTNRIRFFEKSTSTTFKNNPEFMGVTTYGVKDYGTVTGQGLTTFSPVPSGSPNPLWSHGIRDFADWQIKNKPPGKFQVEWPFRTIYDGVPQDFPVMEDIFTWNGAVIKVPGYLNNMVTTYLILIGDTPTEFNIVDTSSDKVSRRWTNKDGSIIVQYYSSRSMWVVADKYENILYHTDTLDVFTERIEALSWYTASGTPIDLGIAVEGRQYVLDINMKNYHGKFNSATDFSSKIHAQAMEFIQMYIEDSANGEATFNSLYEKIKRDRCVSDMVEIDLLGGKTFTEYFNTDDDNIKILKQQFEDYDKEPDPSLSYAKLTNIIVSSLYPVADSLLSAGTTIMTERYRKSIKLFKSMIPYNLAFISSNYSDISSTIFRPVNMSVDTEYYLKSEAEVDVYREDCRTKYFAIYPTGYIDQVQNLKWHSIVPEDATDMRYKISILNNSKGIVQILDTGKTKTVKRNKLKKLFEEEGYSTSELTALVNWILDHPEELYSIHAVTNAVKRETIDDTLYDVFDPYEYRTTKDTEIQEGKQYFVRESYALTTDTVFQDGTNYYTRSGLGTVASPFTYELAEVPVGEEIPEFTYFVVRRPCFRVITPVVGEPIPEGYLYERLSIPSFNEDVIVIGKDATVEQGNEILELLTSNNIGI